MTRLRFSWGFAPCLGLVGLCVLVRVAISAPAGDRRVQVPPVPPEEPRQEGDPEGRPPSVPPPKAMEPGKTQKNASGLPEEHREPSGEMPKSEVLSPEDRPPLCLILPLSGPHGALGQRILGALRESLDAAGVVGWEVRDGGGTEEGVAAAAAWARERGCKVWLGGLGDRESRALAREAATAQARLVGFWGIPVVPNTPNQIGVTPDRRGPMRVLARHWRGLSIEKAFLLVGPGTGDRERAAAFQEAFDGGTVFRVEAAGDARGEALSLARAIRAERVGIPCPSTGILLLAEPDLAVRWKGFLEAEGVMGSQGKCPAPVLGGPPSWLTPEALRRYSLALEGAFSAAWMGEEEEVVSDPLILGVRLAVQAALHLLRGGAGVPVGGGWEGIEVPIGNRTVRFLGDRWRGIDPVPARLEAGRVRWLGDPEGLPGGDE